MTNKLMYRLGLEELAEVAPIAEVPSVSETELQLDQMGNELHGDVKLLDVLSADTETLEDVKSSLEQALKGTVSRGALSFAKRAVDMVDRRWGGDYPAIGMEADEDSVVASMEDGVGQRLKDMGKALLEMLKRVWAKLKEWGGKILQLLGLKKKRLQEIEKEAQLIKEERWEEVGGYSHISRENSDGSKTHVTSKVITREDYAAPVPTFAGTHHDTVADIWAKKENKPVQVSKPEVPHVYIGEFNPYINVRDYAVLIYKGHLPEKWGFSDPIANISSLSMIVPMLNEIAKGVIGVLQGKNIITAEMVMKCQEIMAKHYAEEFRVPWFRSYMATSITLPGQFAGTIPVRAVTPKERYLSTVHTRQSSYDIDEVEEIAKKLTPANIKWLEPTDVEKTSKELEENINRITARFAHADEEFAKYSKVLADIFQKLDNGAPEGTSDNRFLNSFVHHYSTCYVDTKGFYMGYLNRFIAALTKHLELSNDYWKHQHLVNAGG